MPPPENRSRVNSIPEAVSRIIEEGSIAAIATLIEGRANVGAKLLVQELASAAATGSLGDKALDQAVVQHAIKFIDSKEETRVFQVKEFAPALGEWSEAQILFERIQPTARLVICGAGHVGAALARLASLVGYRATLIDDRAEFVRRDHFPDDRIELVAAENWFEAVHTAVGDGHGVSVAVVTRGHSEDEQCMRAIVNTEADYIGLIGSKRRTNIVLKRLRENGADEQQLEKVRAPVGLDIGAVTPEEVALAIMAEIIAVRRGGEGGSLSTWRRNEK
ncbi:MAG: XdhC family protein [Acidobacteriota bacterium]|nr:XdhC family protein [Acidobacteriota bacterium]